MSAEEQKETLQHALSKLRDVGEEDVKTFIKFIDRDWTSANDAKTFTDNKLSGLFDTTSIKASIDALAAAPGPDISSRAERASQGVSGFHSRLSASSRQADRFLSKHSPPLSKQIQNW